MIGKRLATLLVLLLVGVSAFGQYSTYPAKKGAVNDYAGKLDQAQIDELARLIKQYERQTSIEFAVVVADTLHGQSPREYAQDIGNSWGVGKAGRNNGIVLLWAPNERAYALRIADGLSVDLSDADAATITGENLLPNFKRGDYYAGLKETLVATMQQLGDKTWDERVQARARAAQSNRTALGLAVYGGISVVMVSGLAVLIWIRVSRSRQRREKLAEMAAGSTAIVDSLLTAEKHAPQIQQLFDDLRKNAPEQDLTALSNDLAGQAGRIASIRSDAARLNFTDVESYDEMAQIRDRAETESALLGNMQLQVGAIKRAREQSRDMMAQLSQQSFTISDVRDSSRRSEIDQLLLTSRQYYDQACQNSSMSVVDWLIIHSLLNNSRNQVQQATQVSQAAPYTPSFELTESDGSGSSVLDSSSSLFGGDGNSSNSTSFGGGGGFSGGSGSDGSY